MPDQRGETETAPRRRGRPRRATARPAIVEAALELLAERGFQATTMDSIAARAGVGKNTIYRRWSSKEELIADAVRELTAEVDPRRDGDLYSSLLAQARGLRRLFADPLVGRVLPGLVGELHRNPEFAAVWADRVVRPRRQAIVELLARAAEQGELRTGVDPDLIADLLVGPLFIRLLFAFGLPELSTRYEEELLETLWRGVAPSDEPAV